jgi:glycerol kinase
MARFDGLCQRLADLSGLGVERPAAVEATAQGVAWLLGAAAPENGRASRYLPRSNAALEKRFEQWRAWLEASLAGLVDTGPPA